MPFNKELRKKIGKAPVTSSEEKLEQIEKGRKAAVENAAKGRKGQEYTHIKYFKNIPYS
ncbi:MAG: hypothetical protein WCV41_00705 [Patescibacteria group bacterium]